MMEKIKELWANPRYKATIKLGLWFIFLLGIIIVFGTSSNKAPARIENKEKEEVKFGDILELQNKLLSNNVKYNFKINNMVDNSLVIYDGEINEGVDVGYLESKSEIYKYSCTLETCYKLFVDHKEEFAMENYPLLFIKNNFDMMKDIDVIEKIENNMKIYSYVINVQEEDWKLEVSTNPTDILMMRLSTSKEIYEINFEY